VERQRLYDLRSVFIAELEGRIPEAIVHGGDVQQAPHIISVSFPGISGEMLLFHLDQAGIYTSMGSACNAEVIEPSHVLIALGLAEDVIAATLRFSIGTWTNKEDLDHVLQILPKLLSLSKEH
jgi:cysteine desulfurase